MYKFYLAPLKVRLFDRDTVGILLKVDSKGKETVIDPEDVKLEKVPRGGRTELSEDKFNYLMKIEKERRMEVNKGGTFEKMKEMKINGEYLINKERSTVKGISEGGFIVVNEKGGRRKTIKMTEIDTVENVEYYICVELYGRGMEEGTLVVDEGGKRSVYPGGGYVSNIGKLERIQRGEMIFLGKYPREERVKIYKDGLWEEINNLRVGEQCCLRGDRDGTSYTIKSINVRDGGVEYDLRSKGGPKTGVDQSEILPLMKTQSKIDKEQKMENKRSIEVTTREEEVDSADKTKINKRRLTTNSIFVECEYLGLTIIDPKKVSKISSGMEKDFEERVLVLKGDKHTAILRWKGLVNDVISLGCETDAEFSIGSDGRYIGEDLFKCSKNKGVLIPVKIEDRELHYTCERESGACHKSLTKTNDDIVEEGSICCIKGERTEESDIVIKGGIKGRCKWRGLVNGEKCVGVDLDQSVRINGYVYENLINRMRLFNFTSFKGAIFAEEDIGRSLYCDRNKVDIVNPTNIQSLQNGESTNKIIILKQNNNNTLVVTLRWKGEVNGGLCLGCEMGEDSEYGTDGTFKGGQVFKSKDKRGVMIVLDESVECCERIVFGDKVRHREIKTDGVNDCINEECICCVESRVDVESVRGTKDRIILRDDFSGMMKWTGRINGEDCVGVEMERDVRNGSDGTFKGVKIFSCRSKKGVLMKSADISKTLKCDVINMNVVNHTNIEIVTPLKEMSLFVILRANKVVRPLEVRGTFNVDGIHCVACVLPSPYKHGTNGSFGGCPLFICGDDKAVMINIEDFTINCLKVEARHKALEGSVNGYIKEDLICCIKDSECAPRKNESLVKVKMGKYKIFGKALWSGTINGVNVQGIELNVPGQRGTEGTFCGVKLFECSKDKGYLYMCEDLELAPRIDYVEGVYLKSDCDIREVEHGGGDMEGRLVCVEDTPRRYGRAMFYMTIMSESLMAIKISDGDARRGAVLSKDKVFSEDIVGERNVVIVKCARTRVFKEELKSMRGSPLFIESESIKVREECETKEVNKGDIVRWGSEKERGWGRIKRVELLNDVRCVSVVNTMEVGEGEGVGERYIREDRVEKVDTSLKYIENVIIDPKSIVSFKEEKYENLNVKVADEVGFMSLNLKKYAGKIFKFVKVNEVPCAIVEVTSVSPGENIKPYFINEIFPFKDIRGLKKDSAFVAINTLQKSSKKIIFCDRNKVFVLDPLNIKSITQRSVEDKIISFKSKGENIVALLKWIGVIDGERILGCEMRENSLLGFDGSIGSERLFECKRGKGALIVAEKVEECCVKGRCRDLKRSRNGGIVGSSVCCAQRSLQLSENSELKLGERVIRTDDKEYLFGICRWMGVVNGEEVIGVEMVCGTAESDKDECMDRLALFDCPNVKRGLFFAKEFTYDAVGLCYCRKNGVLIVDVGNINSVRDGERLRKMMVYRDNNRSVVVDIRWRGEINGVWCVGCEMDEESDFGTDGAFGGERLFECARGRGVLVAVERMRGSCMETGVHRDIKKGQSGGIEGDSICCMETVDRLELWRNMKIGSKINREEPGKVYGVNIKTGECKWMGRVNGKDAVGVKMKDTVKCGRVGKFSFFKLFKCKEGKGLIFLSEDVEHDCIGEEIMFITDKVLNVKYTWKIKTDNTNTVNGMKIGDYVSTRIDGKEYRGELKWMGFKKNNKKKPIEDITFLGIDLEEAFEHGMDGVINVECKFDCLPRNGVVTTMDNVLPIKEALKLKLNKDGILNANKYLRCEEKSNEKYLKEKNVCKGGPMFIVNGKCQNMWKRKGTLRWIGMMNGADVAVVELDKDYDYGTDGRFWRHQLIKCKDKRAVAVSLDNIFEYKPYDYEIIPRDQRKFEEIDLNSSVIHYIPISGMLTNFYGKVKWSGVNEEGEYLYGIEMDDRYKEGTDGEFRGQRLFKCANGHGVLASIDHVAPDSRFKEIVYTDSDVLKSEVCDIAQYPMPVKIARGENCGIQGNANSSYFDSSIFALFSKSDVLDFMISALINYKEKIKETKDFRDVLSWKIVYPLRKFGFVSFHHTKEMREVIKKYGGKFEEMTKHETDMENVSALLTKLCPTEQLISLKTFNGFTNKSMFLPLFLILDKQRKYMSSQEMLDMSMAQNDIMFEKPPTCLIIQAPRDAKGINCYEYVLPFRTIEISDLCSSHFKKCFKCDSKATFQCKKCIETSLRAKEGLFCRGHKCHHKEILECPREGNVSKSEVQMELRAIICIEKAHFVTYVKEDEFNAEWVFFDSMSTQNITNNYAVPKVSFDTKSSHFLNMDEKEMKSEMKSYGTNPSLKRIVKDSYIFVYHNTSMTCY